MDWSIIQIALNIISHTISFNPEQENAMKNIIFNQLGSSAVLPTYRDYVAQKLISTAIPNMNIRHLVMKQLSEWPTSP